MYFHQIYEQLGRYKTINIRIGICSPLSTFLSVYRVINADEIHDLSHLLFMNSRVVLRPDPHASNLPYV